jgi:hypothetical protein
MQSAQPNRSAHAEKMSKTMLSAVLILLLVLSPVLIPAIITAFHTLAGGRRNLPQIPSTPRAAIRLAPRQYVAPLRVAIGDEYPAQRAETAA